LIDTATSSLKIRRTKIIATLGPASSEFGQIKDLINAGVNIFRQNFSHGDHKYHEETYLKIRKAAKELDKTISILADLCGPKIRTGKFENDKIELINDQSVVVTTRDVIGNSNLIPSQYKELAKDIEIGNRILLADGTLELKVNEINDTEIKCTVVYGGVLGNHKGINLPGVNVSAPSLTEKDKEDAKLALELGVDFLALSFVRSASDIYDLKKLVEENSCNGQIIAKIEKPEALEDAKEIIKAADGIMVARGDLGVELNPEQVPVAQHQLIDLARKKFKPVIVATQMLESMIENARPTRAEVTDVAYAVTLGTDAIMLSGETAVGAFPIDAVKMMDRIARQTEIYLWTNNVYGSKISSNASKVAIPVWDAVANSMSRLAQDLKVRAVVVISKSGATAATMSSARPAAPIIAITKTINVCQRILMHWGVVPILSESKIKILMKPKKAFLKNSARDLYWQRFQEFDGKTMLELEMSITESVPSQPKTGKLAGKTEPLSGWVNFFKKEGLIKIIEEKDPAVVARNVVIKEKLASAGQKILLVQGFQSDDALNKPSVTVLTI
jgi:pyruvate kinase|tara:strand:- start:2243 stop:3919 length:1677 start_codon:yes stop_codon:yes gene_type:complete